MIKNNKNLNAEKIKGEKMVCKECGCEDFVIAGGVLECVGCHTKTKAADIAIRYTPELDIRNILALRRGTGLRYLLCIDGIDGELIAKAWKRILPENIGSIETVIDFGAAL